MALRLTRSTPFMRVLLHLLDLVLEIYTWVLFADMVLYWLIAFGAIDEHRRAVALVHGWLLCVGTPMLRPIRAIAPKFGGIDVSPLIAILMIVTVRYLIALYVLPKIP
jgi:YggT family protein